MVQRRSVTVLLALSLFGNAFCIPAELPRVRRREVRISRETDDLLPATFNHLRQVRQDEAKTSRPPAKDDSLNEVDPTSKSTIQLSSPSPFDDDDDDDDDFNEPAPPSTGGSGGGIFSLLRLAGALFPGSSGGNVTMRKIIQRMILRKPQHKIMRRQDIKSNAINHTIEFKPRQDDESENESESENSVEDSEESEDSEDENNAAESAENDAAESAENDAAESAENDAAEEGVKNEDDRQDNESASVIDDSDDNSDESPEGDGQGGGLLGVLAGLSGGGDESDLGSLLATVGGIVANLSGGEDFDLNSIISTAIGLFVGLLSGGEENPGSIIASYFLTSLDTITGGGSTNNGAFFGTLLTKLLKGTSALVDPDASSESDTTESDSGGFIKSFLVSLLGDMSKTSSSGSNSNSRRGKSW